MNILKAVFLFLFMLPAVVGHAQGRVDTRKRPDIFSRTTNMYVDHDRSPADSIMLAAMLQGIRSGTIHAYSDSGCTTILTSARVDSIAAQTIYADSFYFPYPESGEASIVVIGREGSFYGTRDFRIVVQSKPVLKFLAFGIDRDNHLPIDKRELGQPAPYQPKKTFFWMPYNEVRGLIVQRDMTAGGKKLSEWLRAILAESEAAPN